MKSIVLKVLASAVALLFFASWSRPAYGQYTIEYGIHLQSDRSAIWLIKQGGLNIQISTSTLVDFQANVNSLIDSVRNHTGRDMVAENFRITADVAGSYTMVQYGFRWENFSESGRPRIVLSDVFQCEGFFGRLFGDGRVILSYPARYVVESVTPTPYQQNESLKTIEWLGTIDLTQGEYRLELREESTTDGLEGLLRDNTLFIISIVAVAAGFSVLYLVKRGKDKAKNHTTPEGAGVLEVVNGEDQIIRLLQASNGRALQSSIVKTLNFSKAKTSQLLASLETKGKIKRIKRGREKIVILNDRTE
jgi:hypothetical protein